MGKVKVVARDGIAITIQPLRREPVEKRFRFTPATKLLVPKPGKPDPGDTVTGNVDVFRYHYGTRADLRPGVDVSVGWEDSDRAVFIEIQAKTSRSGVVIAGYPPLQPTPLPATQPTSREVN
jgi:hypothetical protein